MTKKMNTLEDDKRSIVLAEVMTPDMTNFAGHVHGGHLMLLLDKAAYACAARYSGHYAVTLSVDHIFFKEPIFVGEMVMFYATVNYVGTTSMEIGIKVVAENLTDGSQRHTNTCYFTMVALDKNQKPCKVPKLKLRNDVERYRTKEAELRRGLRLEYTKKHQAHKKNSNIKD